MQGVFDLNTFAGVYLLAPYSVHLFLHAPLRHIQKSRVSFVSAIFLVGVNHNPAQSKLGAGFDEPRAQHCPRARQRFQIL